MNNSQKGFTLFELLVTISVGSVMITMLMSIMSSTLLARNQMDYTNKVYEDVYYISEFFNLEFFELGFRSIEDISPEDPNHYVFRLRKEYEIAIDEITGVIYRDYSVAYANILHLDLSSGNLYYGPEEEFVDGAFTNPIARRLNSPNVLFLSGSSITSTCLRDTAFDGNIRCSRAVVEFDFVMTVELSGGTLPPKSVFTSLFY